MGPHLDHPAMLDLLQHYPSPAAMKTAGTTRMATRLLKLAPRMGRRLAEDITQALGEQTVVVVGTHAAATALPRLAEQLAALRRQRSDIAPRLPPTSRNRSEHGNHCGSRRLPGARDVIWHTRPDVEDPLTLAPASPASPASPATIPRLNRSHSDHRRHQPRLPVAIQRKPSR